MAPSGVQPAFVWAPPSYTTLGDEVADLSTEINFPPDPEQRQALDMVYAAREDRTWAAFEFCLICVRQNMKTGLFKMCAIADLFLFDDPLVLWTAHRYDATEGAFRDIKNLIDGAPILSRRVKSITSGTGDMEIILHTPPSATSAYNPTLQFVSRISGSARSKSAAKLFYDEAFALRPSDIGDSVPTLATIKGAQIRYGSSAGKATSAVLRSVRDRGRRGGDPGLAYLEYADMLPPSCAAGDQCTHAVGSEGCCLDDPARWKRAGPAVGRRITEERIAQFRAMMPPAEFAREFLGWWDEPIDVLGVFGDPGLWPAALDPMSSITGPVSLSLEVSQDSAWCCIGAAGYRDDGVLHGELIENRPGTSWAVPRLVDLVGRHGGAVVVSPLSPAAGLIPALVRAGVDVIKMSGPEYVQASGQIVTLVREGNFRHLGQNEVDVAMAASTLKGVGDAKVIDRKSDVDISPFVALVLAAWAAVTRPPEPAPVMPMVEWR